MKERDHLTKITKPNNSAVIRESGNSIVIVYFDSAPIGYAHLCGMHAAGKLDDVQFQQAVQEFRRLLREDPIRQKFALLENGRIQRVSA